MYVLCMYTNSVLICINCVIVKSVVLFPPPFYFIFENSTSYRTYKIISSNELARPVIGRAKRARRYLVMSMKSRDCNSYKPNARFVRY